MPVSKSRPIVGRAMLTTVASSEAIPEPSTVTNSTHRPGADEYESAGASAVVIWQESSRVHPLADRPACKFSICDRGGWLLAAIGAGRRPHTPAGQLADPGRAASFPASSLT